MPILFECPSCHKQLRVQDALVGKRIKCPNCMKVVTAPAGEGVAPAPPPIQPPTTRPPAAPPREDLTDEIVDYQGEEERGHDDADDERRRRKKKKARRGGNRVTVPAIFMMILAGMGALFAIISTIVLVAGMGLVAVAAENQPKPQPDPFARPDPFGRPGQPEEPRMDPNAAAKIKEYLAASVGVTIAIGVLSVVFHGLIMLGSIFMLKLRAYGFAVTAAVLCMISGVFGCVGGGVVAGALFAPCGCAGLIFLPLYLGVGIWALVVLMSADVKSAFG